MKKEVLSAVYEYSKRPEVFENGTGNIWTEPYLATQMLEAHLNKDWDAASRKEKSIEQTVKYLSTVLSPGCSVLDLGCGPGLYAEHLTNAGFRMTGVDFSENSINFAKDNARKMKLDIKYNKANFFDLVYKDEFDAVMQIYGEMNTFSDKDRDRLFSIILNALKPGGLFVFDVTTPNNHHNSTDNTSWYSSDGGFYRPGKHFVLESNLSYDNDVWLDQYIVVDEDNVVVYRNWFHEYTASTIKNVLLNAGFSDVTVSEKLYGEEQQEVNWLTVIAKK